LSRSPSPANVTVTVPARLHLGFLDLNGGLGRRFGTDDCSRVGPRIRRSLARNKGQGWSASGDDSTLIEKVA
jgi:predicted sugar kinase